MPVGQGQRPVGPGYAEGSPVYTSGGRVYDDPYDKRQYVYMAPSQGRSWELVTVSDVWCVMCDV